MAAGPAAATQPRFYERASRFASLGLLLAAAVVLLWGLVSALQYTSTHSGPPCSNPPQRNAEPPQLVVVGLCLGAFLLGHLSSRWQEVGHEREMEDAERGRQALTVQALLLVFLLEVVGLLVVEMVTLSRGVWPITYYVRCAYNAAGWPSTLAAAATLLLVGRWFWLPARRRRARTSS